MERYDEVAKEILTKMLKLEAQVAALTAELEEYRGLAEQVGAETAVSDRADLQAALDAERIEKSKWIQAVGLASTCAGDMPIDVEHPIEMMQTVCARFADLTQQLEQERARREGVEQQVALQSESLLRQMAITSEMQERALNAEAQLAAAQEQLRLAIIDQANTEAELNELRGLVGTLSKVRSNLELLRDYTYTDAEPPELRAQNERAHSIACELLQALDAAPGVTE